MALFHNTPTKREYPRTCDMEPTGLKVDSIQDFGLDLYLVSGNLPNIYLNYWGGNIYDPKQAMAISWPDNKPTGYKLIDEYQEMLQGCAKDMYFIRMGQDKTLIIERNIQLNRLAKWLPEFARVLSQTDVITDAEAENTFNRVVTSFQVMK